MAFLDVLRIILAVINVTANVVSSIFGVVLIGVGIAGLVFFNLLGLTSESVLVYNGAFGLFIAIGFFLCLSGLFEIVGSFFACCTDNRIVKTIAAVLLTIGLIVLVIAFILDLSGLILGFVFRERITADFVPLLNQAVNGSYATSPNETQAFMEGLQLRLGCCGINGPEDFATYPGYPNAAILPLGCCNTSVSTCTVGNALNGTSCGVLLMNGLVSYYTVITGIGVFEVILMLLLVVVELLLLILVLKSGDNGFTKVI